MARDQSTPVLITMEHSMTSRGLHELSDAASCFLLKQLNSLSVIRLQAAHVGGIRPSLRIRLDRARTQGAALKRPKHIYISNFH